MSKYKLLRVDWVDSSTWDDWARVGEPFRISHCRTVGYLIRETKHHISLAPSLGGYPLRACGTMSIPKGAIRKRKSL